ncbi:MAG: helix-turn-helix transcriptional regulator [Clostridiales bacterium]|nr:helix-turn-helix transcriptional regulator [Clostridiales bacterium]
MSDKIQVTCEMEVTLKVIGGKWKPLILHYLQYEGTKRYTEILRYLKSAPKKTLTVQLRELEEDGIISRRIIPTVPVQVEYSVTKHGETLYPVLEAMCDWGHANLQERYELTHPTCSNEEKK